MIDREFLKNVTINDGEVFKSVCGYCVKGAWAAAMGLDWHPSGPDGEWYDRFCLLLNNQPPSFKYSLSRLEDELMQTEDAALVKQKLLDLVDMYFPEVGGESLG